MVFSERIRGLWQGGRGQAIRSISVLPLSAFGTKRPLEGLNRPLAALGHHVFDRFRYGRGREERRHVLNVLVRDLGCRRAAFALVLLREVLLVKHRP